MGPSWNRLRPRAGTCGCLGCICDQRVASFEMRNMPVWLRGLATQRPAHLLPVSCWIFPKLSRRVQLPPLWTRQHCHGGRLQGVPALPARRVCQWKRHDFLLSLWTGWPSGDLAGFAEDFLIFFISSFVENSFLLVNPPESTRNGECWDFHHFFGWSLIIPA